MPNILTCVFYNSVQQNVTALCCAKAFIGTINLVAFFAALFHLFCFVFSLFYSLLEVKYHVNIDIKSSIAKGLLFFKCQSCPKVRNRITE